METSVGPETKLKAQGVDGKIKLSADYEGADVSAELSISATPDQICKALADLIPGDSGAEHAALAVVKGALDLAVK